jgi:hypothetical protein
VFLTNEKYSRYDDLFDLQSRVIFGSAILHSQSFHREPTLLTLLSETDMKRQQGGTRDTILSWPPTFKHTNINPDRLHAPFSQVSAQSPASPQAPMITGKRPVLFVVFADLARVDARARGKLRSAIDKYFDDGMALNRHLSDENSFVIVGHDGDVAAMDFVRYLMASASNIGGAPGVSIGLHVGPVYLDVINNHENRILECETVEWARTLAGYAQPGSVCAGHDFAAVLALSLKKFQLDYAGVMRLPGDSDSRAIYNVTITDPAHGR